MGDEKGGGGLKGEGGRRKERTRQMEREKEWDGKGKADALQRSCPLITTLWEVHFKANPCPDKTPLNIRGNKTTLGGRICRFKRNVRCFKEGFRLKLSTKMLTATKLYVNIPNIPAWR